jgi:hypothetical protein
MSRTRFGVRLVHTSLMSGDRPGRYRNLTSYEPLVYGCEKLIVSRIVLPSIAALRVAKFDHVKTVSP